MKRTKPTPKAKAKPFYTKPNYARIPYHAKNFEGRSLGYYLLKPAREYDRRHITVPIGLNGKENRTIQTNEILR